MPDASVDSLILRAKWSARFTGWFYLYVRRNFAKKFHAVRMERSSVAISKTLDDSSGPLMIVMNHCAWWDVLVFVYFYGAFVPTRRVTAPMDRVQLQRFSMFRRLGVFGIDPDSARTLPAMVRYVQGEIAIDPRAVILLNPQGKFFDVRSPVEIRPGAAVLAAKIPNVRVVAAAVEYGFWTDARPEMFLRLRDVPTPTEPTTAGWQRAIALVMQSNADELAACVMARDGDAFVSIIGGDKAKIHPVYDFWLRMTGRKVGIDLSMRTKERVTTSQ